MVVLYGRASHFDWVGFDDQQLIVERLSFLRDWRNLPGLLGRNLGPAFPYYRPAVEASFAAQAGLGHAAPGFHVFGVGLHVANALLLYSFMIRLGARLSVAAVSALCFSLHPAVAEAVAWVPGRGDLLVACFGLLSFLSLQALLRRPTWVWWSLHGLCVVGALLSKESAILLPVALLLMARAKGDVERTVSRRLGLLYLVLTSVRCLVGYIVGGASLLAASSDRSLLREAIALAISVGKMVLPISLAPIATPEDASWAVIAVGAALIAVAAIAVATKRLRPQLWILAMIFLPLLTQVLVSDRPWLECRLYMPMCGAALALSRLLEVLPGRVTLGFAGGYALIVGAASWSYLPVFGDRRSFWEAAAERAPHSYVAHLNRGVWRQEVGGDLQGAARDYQTALRIDPMGLNAHNNLGVMRLGLRDWTGAEAEFRAELLNDPTSAKAHYNLGLALMGLGRRDEAAREWEEALRNEPAYVDAMGQLMVYWADQGDEQRRRSYEDLLRRSGAAILPGPPAQ